MALFNTQAWVVFEPGSAYMVESYVEREGAGVRGCISLAVTSATASRVFIDAPTAESAACEYHRRTWGDKAFEKPYHLIVSGMSSALQVIRMSPMVGVKAEVQS